MFKKNTIGEKINEILVKNGKDKLFNCSFEEAVNNSCHFKRLINEPIEDQKNLYFNPFENENKIVEDWLASLRLFFIVLFEFGGVKQIGNEDKLVMIFIKTALIIENNEVYHNNFDAEYFLRKNGQIKIKKNSKNNISEIDKIRYSCFEHLMEAPDEIFLNYIEIINNMEDKSKNEWMKIENELKKELKNFKEAV